MKAYLVKFITDYVILLVPISADTEEQAELLANEILKSELGLELNRYEVEITVEGEWN